MSEKQGPVDHVFLRADMHEIEDYNSLTWDDRGTLVFLIMEQANSENLLLDPDEMRSDKGGCGSQWANESINNLIELGYIRLASDGYHYEVTPKEWFSFTEPEEDE